MDNDVKRPLLQTGAGQISSASSSSPVYSNFYKFPLARAVDVETSVDKATEAGTVGSVNTTAKPDASPTTTEVIEVVDKISLPCDPSRWMHRYFMLFFMCMLSFGSYYVYDNPTALQRTIMKVSLLCTAGICLGTGGTLARYCE